MPQIEKIYQCQRCSFRFEIPLRELSEDGYYNLCPQCKWANLDYLYVIDGVGEFDDKRRARRAYYSLKEGE